MDAIDIPGAAGEVALWCLVGGCGRFYLGGDCCCMFIYIYI